MWCVTFDNMLRLRRLLGEPIANDSEEEMGKNENEKVNSNIFTISYYGITSLLAISIYDAYIFGPAFNVPNLGLLPMVINPQWIGRECLGLILRLIQDPQRPARVDKGMFLLIFLAKHVNVTVDCKTLTNPRLPGPLVTLQKFDLVQGLEMISSTAAMCPNADLRYVAYQLIKCFIDMCDPEAQLFVFLELLETCPLQAMRAATVNLLKDRIAAAFDNDNETSFFKSHVITDKLFPLIFKKPSSSTLWETYGVEMQVLNCYLYLLIRDKALDQTGVWGDKIIDVVKYTYLEPLEKTIKTLEKEVSGAPNIDSEMKQSQTMQLSLLRNLLDQVNEQLVRKKDRCR
ncbi:hypothetical protein BDA99DRAFT_133277 [Phascolomyces articulosus]|uniref:Uncharacterized protein n=1 Tax=Phascolomyces articulosus TaxID=60185 RepID=A0AAD5K6J1_9FUNG|nr:hypothetical protein BDA99DRAFT_133277 [Phascolomyces articulosus]